jgi:hypothetical protein
MFIITTAIIEYMKISAVLLSIAPLLEFLNGIPSISAEGAREGES